MRYRRTSRQAAFRGIRRIACAAACLLPIAVAATPASAQDPPPAATVIARFHEAVGGVDRLRSHSSVRSRGEYAVPAAGITATFESLLARPNRRLMRVDVPGFGEIRTGYTGTMGWSHNAAEGPRVMEGEEALQAADDADFNFQFRLPGGYESMTTVERSSVAGEDCWRVRVTWASGRETFDCYSVETGLLLSSNIRQVMSSGTVEVVQVYDEYRSFDGILMPTRITARVGSLEQVLTRREVVFDDVQDAELQAPAEVQALVDH